MIQLIKKKIAKILRLMFEDEFEKKKILEAKKKIPSLLSSGILSITLDNGEVVSLQDHSYFQEAWVRLSGKEYIAMEEEYCEKIEGAFKKIKGK